MSLRVDVVDGRGDARDKRYVVYAAAEAALNSIRDEEVVVAVGQMLCREELVALLAHPRIRSVLIPREDAAMEREFPGRVGRMNTGASNWVLPDRLARTIIFVDDTRRLGVRRVVVALRRGFRWVVVPGFDDRAWEKRGISGILFEAVVRSAIYRLMRVSLIRLILGLRYVKMLVFETRQRWFEQRFRHIVTRLNDGAGPMLSQAEFVSGRILLVSASLGPGGTERQIVNTAVGLSAHGYRDVSILCGDLTPEQAGFYRKTAEEGGVTVAERSRVRTRAIVAAGNATNERVRELTRKLPREIAADIVGLIQELLDRRPSVVHAWLDETNVLTGIAAAIVGVPRIILSGRSMAPCHYQFHHASMRGGYQVLRERPGVVLINNSRAGAADYAEWLGIPASGIHVVHNGFDFATFDRPAPEATRAYRRSFGIADDRRVVGSVMRFSEEKRPLLWVEVAAALARRRDDLVFLLVGSGAMIAEVRSAVEAARLTDRFVMPGIIEHVASALTAMDTLLLTSRLEGFPNVLVEAQSLGVPVVTTDVGGAAETLDDGITGRAVASAEPEHIARAVLATIEDADWRATAARVGPEWVRRRFSLDGMIEQTLALYGCGPLEGNDWEKGTRCFRP